MKKTMLTTLLTGVHQFSKDVSRLTKPRRRWNRQDVVTTVKLGAVVASAAGALHPAARPVATVLSGLLSSVPGVLPDQLAGDVVDVDGFPLAAAQNHTQHSHYILELQRLEQELQTVTSETKLAALRGQREMLFKLLDRSARTA